MIAVTKKPRLKTRASIRRHSLKAFHGKHVIGDKE